MDIFNVLKDFCKCVLKLIQELFCILKNKGKSLKNKNIVYFLKEINATNNDKKTVKFANCTDDEMLQRFPEQQDIDIPYPINSQQIKCVHIKWRYAH